MSANRGVLDELFKPLRALLDSDNGVTEVCLNRPGEACPDDAVPEEALVVAPSAAPAASPPRALAAVTTFSVAALMLLLS